MTQAAPQSAREAPPQSAREAAPQFAAQAAAAQAPAAQQSAAQQSIQQPTQASLGARSASRSMARQASRISGDSAHGHQAGAAQNGGTGGYPAEAPAPRTSNRARTPPRSVTPTPADNRASTSKSPAPQSSVKTSGSRATTRPKGEPLKEHQGAHYAYVSPELADIRANDYDVAQLDNLQPKMHQRRPAPSSPVDGSTTEDVSPRSTTPVRQRAAFTDRSVRMREGVGARIALRVGQGQEFVAPEEQDQSADALAVAENQANSRKPAGVTSHRVRRAEAEVWSHTDDRTEPRAKVIRETIGEQFAKIYANSTVGVEEQAQDDEKLRRHCGRKVRAGSSPAGAAIGGGLMLPHRGQNAEDEAAPAGVVRPHHPEVLKDHKVKARSVTPPKRSGVAQVFEPQVDDVIEKPKSGVKVGEFSSGYSQESARHAIQGAALQLRYANWDQAQKVTKATAAETFIGAAGAKAPANADVVSARGTPLTPKKTREERGVPPTRNPINVEEMNRSAEQHRIARLQKDPCFADLVQNTKSQYEARRAERDQIRGGGKHVSAGVAAIMSWEA